jgi:hypothetical protein
VTEYQVQLIILAGAYALAGLLMIVSTAVTVVSWRSFRTLESKRSVLTRLTTVENEIRSHSDLVDRLSKRWSKRERDARKESDPEVQEEDPRELRERMVAEFNQGKRIGA